MLLGLLGSLVEVAMWTDQLKLDFFTISAIQNE